MSERWNIITPFKVLDPKRFRSEAENNGLWGEVFQRNQAGYFYCASEMHEDERSLSDVQAFLQPHLPRKEFALFRIYKWTLEEHPQAAAMAQPSYAITEDHIRYEKVYSDRIEPTVYSDDPARRR